MLLSLVPRLSYASEVLGGNPSTRVFCDTVGHLLSIDESQPFRRQQYGQGARNAKGQSLAGISTPVSESLHSLCRNVFPGSVSMPCVHPLLP